jgi:hypothetical protein
MSDSSTERRLIRVFRATTPADLDKVTWLTHDCWFDLDAARWDRERHSFEMSFGRGAERRGFLGIVTSRPPSHYDCAVSIKAVRSVTVEDEAEVGTYDLNTISYDDTRRAVVIESNIPLKITLEVGEVDVLVQIEGELHSREGGLSWYTDGVDVRSALVDFRSTETQ